jgi:hypothetical protein
MKCIFNSEINVIPFDTSMLKIGEMMELHEQYIGQVVLCTYKTIISLSDPNHTWGRGTRLSGRKLLPGESVTLIQE